MLQHHRQVLEALMSEPECRLSQFPLLTQAEQHLFALNNATAHPLETRWSIVQLFERQVQMTPNAIACRCETESLSYAELNARANRLAHALQEEGVSPGVRVALHVPRASDWLVGLLGIFKPGGVYVPLDINYPASYLQRIVEDAKPRLIVTTQSTPQELHAGLKWKCLSMDAQALAHYRETDLESAWRPEHLAYVMYTSGSTGEPKGVMVPHLQFLNWLQAMWRRMPFQANDVVAQKTTVAFSVSVKELLAGLLAGVPQVFIPDEAVKDAEAFLKILDRERVTRLNIVPTHWQVLLNHLGEDADLLRALKHLMISGEPLTRALRDATRVKLPWVQLWNVFGCTELNDTTYCSPTEQEGGSVFVSIGRPIANTRIHVLDSMLQPEPIGVPGELCVDSVGMVYGYWGQAAMTAERFVPNPFSEFDAADARLENMDGERPVIRFIQNGAMQEVVCDYAAGCDGFHGISRASIPLSAIQQFSHIYPIAWLGILAQAPIFTKELVYSVHERGFSLFSMRSPELSRAYLQCAPGEDVSNWPDERIWSELHTRLESDDGRKLNEGPLLNKSITPMRSFVIDPMQYGRLFLAGDAAHIVPPSAAKGLNSAVADAVVLFRAMKQFYKDGSNALLARYSSDCLMHVWRQQQISWRMTNLLHRFDDRPLFEQRMQKEELRNLIHTRSAGVDFAENYVGLPWAESVLKL